MLSAVFWQKNWLLLKTTQYGLWFVKLPSFIHHLYIMQTPEKLGQGLLWDPAGQHREYGDLIARSSRTLEPFLFELIDRMFPGSDSTRLLEVGCGYAGYIIYAADKYKRLNAVGLELDLHVAEKARHNIKTRGLHDRVKIMADDVRAYQTDELFEILTLYNNIYYFPVEERIELFKHLLSLLKPNGRILLTTGCMNGGIEFELVNLIHAATKGWGRLPDKDEMLQQLSSVGFVRNRAIIITHLSGTGRYEETGGHRETWKKRWHPPNSILFYPPLCYNSINHQYAVTDM